MNILEIAEGLRSAPRLGAVVDKPEGSRYITLSDTLAVQIAKYLEKHASACPLRKEEVILTVDDLKRCGSITLPIALWPPFTQVQSPVHGLLLFQEILPNARVRLIKDTTGMCSVRYWAEMIVKNPVPGFIDPTGSMSFQIGDNHYEVQTTVRKRRIQ